MGRSGWAAAENGFGDLKHHLIGTSAFERVDGEEDETAVILGVAFGAVDTIDARSERKVFGAAKVKSQIGDNTSSGPDTFAPLTSEIKW